VHFARPPLLVVSYASACACPRITFVHDEPDDARARDTDPQAELYRKGHGQPAKPYYVGHAMIENRHRPVVQRTPRRQPAKLSVRPRWRRPLLGRLSRHGCARLRREVQGKLLFSHRKVGSRRAA
jgi:hypothetical protein